MDDKIKKILDDIRQVDDAYTNTEVKIIAKKYNLDVTKKAEVKHALYGLANNIRRENGIIDENAVYVFNCYWDWPSALWKVAQAMEQETVEFVEYYLYLKKKDYERRRTLWLEKNIRVVEKYLRERKNNTNEVRVTLINNLIHQTGDFYAAFMKARMEYYHWLFKQMLPMKDLHSRQEVAAYLHLDEKELTYAERQEKITRQMRIIANFRVRSNNFNEKEYIDKMRERVKEDYKRRIELIADRILRAKMEWEKISVEQIADNDSKGFKIYVSDGTRRMYARSIFCAEYSIIVEPHFRFIITNK